MTLSDVAIKRPVFTVMISLGIVVLGVMIAPVVGNLLTRHVFVPLGWLRAAFYGGLVVGDGVGVGADDGVAVQGGGDEDALACRTRHTWVR